MSGKRQASNDLNHENWNDEEEPEDRGQFRTASAEEMKSRVIKKARRKVADTGNEPKSAFSGFAGFGDSNKAATSSSFPFSFLSKIPAPTTITNSSNKDSKSEKPLSATDINRDRLNDGASGEPKSVFSGFPGFGKNFNSASTSKEQFSFSNDSVKDSEKPSTSNAAQYFPKISGPSSIPTATADNDKTNNNFSFGESGKSKAVEKPATITSGALTAPSIASDGCLFSLGNNPSGPKTSIFGNSASSQVTGSNDKPSIDNLYSQNGDKSSEFCAKLANLNRKVSDWIKQHVDSNPICILTPIFKDYKKFLKEIEQEEENRCTTNAAATENSVCDGNSKSSLPKSGPVETFTYTAGNKGSLTSISSGISKPGTKPLFSFSVTAAANKTLTTESSDAKKLSTQSSSSTSTEVGIFSGFGTKSIDKALGPPAPPGIFSFSSKPVTPTTFDSSIKSTFSFKSTATTNDDSKNTSAKTESNGFSFGIKPVEKSNPDNAIKPFSLTTNSAAFSFANIQPPVKVAQSTVNTEETQEEEDAPPKVDFKQVVEEDAFYSKKCKVFVKKNDNFADHGVGTLYLKPVKNSGKTQLIVRADTNLGNILVNLILSEGIPSQRMGKNNVMLVCVPSPDVEKPTPTLFRVKTAEEADDLLEMIKKHTK